MSARTDLDNAFSILDAGITAHVTALKCARDTAAAAQAVANDDTYLTELTHKVLTFADVLVASTATVPAVAPVAPVAAPTAPETSVAPVEAPVAPAPVAASPAVAAPVAPSAPVTPPAQPSLMDTMRAVAAEMTAKL